MTDISQRTDDIKGRRQNIAELEEEKKLGLFAIDCTVVNAQLIKQTQLLEKQILSDQLERNRELNRGINKDYEEIGSRLEFGIESTNDLIATIEFFKKLIAEVQDKLSSRVIESQKRLDFLIKYAELAEEDYQLNASVFLQPEHLRGVLEYNEQKLAAKREQTEDEVRKRGTDITDYLESLAKDIHSFFTVEAEVQSEIFANNQKLTTLRNSLDKTNEQISKLNEEEGLLEMDETAYPQLIENIQNIQPFLLLWGTCDNFINQSEAWLNGPFRSLDPEAMSEEV